MAQPPARRHDTQAQAAPAQDEPRLSAAERAVLAALREIGYGQVEVIVHSSRIVQITRSQKLRIDGP